MEKATTKFNNFTGRSLSHETRDCSVVAFAKAFDIPYEKAHAICKKAGRKDKKGFHLYRAFGVSRGKRSRTFLGRRVGYHPWGSMKRNPTVMTFMKKHPKGRFILCVPKHYCALIDGVLHNQYRSLGQRVQYYYKISDLKSKNPQPEAGDLDIKTAL